MIIIDYGSRRPDMRKYLEGVPHRVMRCDEPFNFSRLNNLAANAAGGDYLVFLNDDTEVMSGEWLGAMLEQAQRREVGAVGAKLLYKDGRIQHAGIVLGVNGVANHAHRYADGFNSTGQVNDASLIRNYSAVTAACMMMRRRVFDEAGGFDEEKFPVSYNDVDLCLRLRRRGYLITYTPYALLYHDESASRGLRRYPLEEAALRARWPDEIASDIYYNPNLTATKGDYSADLSKPESLVCIFSQATGNAIIDQLEGSTSVGQEFVAEKDRVCAIAVRMEKAGRGDQGVVRLRLRESPFSQSDIAIAEVEMAQVIGSGWRVFSFAALRRSRGQRLYFFLELAGQAPAVVVKVGGDADAAYAGGQRYANHRPAPGSLAFKVYALEQYRRAAAAV